MADRPRPKGSKGGRRARDPAGPIVDRAARRPHGPSAGAGRPSRRGQGGGPRGSRPPGSRPEGSRPPDAWPPGRSADRAIPDGPGGGPPRDWPAPERGPWRPAGPRPAGPRPRSGARSAPWTLATAVRGPATRPMAARATRPRGISVRGPSDARPSRPPGRSTLAPSGRIRRGTGAGRPRRTADPRRAGARRSDRPTGAPFRGGPPGPRPWARQPIDAGSWPRPAPSLPAPDLLGPDEELVAGRRPVEEVFAAGRTAHRLLVVPQRRDALEQLVLHATRLRIPIVEVEGGSLTALAGFDGHQGVALVVEPRRFATPRRRAGSSRRARRAAVRARPRLARGSAERGHAPAQRRGGRRPRHRLPDATPGAAQPGRGQGVGGRRRAPPAVPGRRPRRRARRPARPRPAGGRLRGGRAADGTPDGPARPARDRRRERGPGARAGRPTTLRRRSCGSRCAARSGRSTPPSPGSVLLFEAVAQRDPDGRAARRATRSRPPRADDPTGSRGRSRPDRRRPPDAGRRTSTRGSRRQRRRAAAAPRPSAPTPGRTAPSAATAEADLLPGEARASGRPARPSEATAPRGAAPRLTHRTDRPYHSPAPMGSSAV